MDLRELLRQALAEAERLAAGHPRSVFRFGDLSVAVRINGAAPMQRLLSMIAARAADDSREPMLIDVIGGPLPGCEALLPLPEMRQRTVLRANADIYYLWLNEADGYLTALDRRAGRGLVWFPAPDRIASWHVARPFLHAIKGFSLHTAWTPIHAASVAMGGKAVLVVGQSGAGKTSIAMTCALQGWDYLGDDAVIVKSRPARVGALYSSARLRADTFERFPEVMTACLGISDDAGEEKAEVDMALLRPQTTGDAEIGAILVPQPTDWTRLRLQPIGRSATLRKLMEATRQSMIGDEAAVFSKLAALVAEVPCYAVTACGDPIELSNALAKLVGEKVAS